MEYKTCPKCRQRLPLSAFGKSRKTKDGLYPRCRTCNAASALASYRRHRDERLVVQQQWRDRNKARIAEISRTNHLRRTFGLTRAQYDLLLAKQGGVCAICGQEETKIDPRSGLVHQYHVDHDHTTGQIRGLLCNNCNVGLGAFGDDVTRLQQALAYLQSPPVSGLIVPANPLTGPATGLRNGKYTHPERTPRGERHGQAKLTQERVDAIFRAAEAGQSQRVIAQAQQVTQAQIQRILAYKTSWRPTFSFDRAVVVRRPGRRAVSLSAAAIR